MFRKFEGIPVVTEMDHTWSHRSSELRHAYERARKALDDLVHAMNDHGIKVEQSRWLEIVQEMAAANVYADSCKVQNCARDHDYEVAPHWLPLKIEFEGGDWLRCHYWCPEHGWRTCGYSALAPFHW